MWIADRRPGIDYGMRGNPLKSTRYCIRWTGREPISYLRNGWTCGSYARKRDAQSRADAMNAAPKLEPVK